MPIVNTPLRYPGGKSKLANYIKSLYRLNNLCDGDYAEPFAGGAGAAITLLLHEYVTNIHINDINPAVYAFWHSVVNRNKDLCERIASTPVTMDTWYKQKNIFNSQDDQGLLDLGFATFFLNRANRSGILSAGVIGGKNQNGTWKIDARYNKSDLISRIQKIGRYQSRINLYNLDAEVFITEALPNIRKKTLVYLDPPYYDKGQTLYINAYTHDDHQRLGRCIVESIEQPWLVSYDNVEPIREIYSDFTQKSYDISYSAADKYKGSELLVYSKGLAIPSVPNPFKVKPTDVKLLEAVE